jgi:hypothetical protein
MLTSCTPSLITILCSDLMTLARMRRSASDVSAPAIVCVCNQAMCIDASACIAMHVFISCFVKRLFMSVRANHLVHVHAMAIEHMR